MIHPAARWRIAASTLTDLLTVSTLGLTVTLVELAIRGSLRAPVKGCYALDAVADWLYSDHSLDAFAHGAVAAIAIGLVVGAVPGVRSPGRRLLGTVVVRSSGRPFSGWVIAMRVAGLLLSGAALGLGFLWALFDPDRRAWHDRLAGTVTVLASSVTDNPRQRASKASNA